MVAVPTHLAVGLTTGSNWVIPAVVIFCLSASAGCLLMAGAFAIWAPGARRARRRLHSTVSGALDAEAQTVSYDGLAHLAAALRHLDLSGRFLLFSLGFASAAAVAAGLSAVH